MNRSSSLAALACLALLAGCGSGGEQSPAAQSGASGGTQAATSSSGESSPEQGATGVPAAKPSVKEGTSCRSMAEEMDLEQKVGQLFMVGTTSSSVDEVETALLEHQVGSVILLGGDLRPHDETAALTEQIQAASPSQIPVLVASDQEGGQVQRLAGPGFETIPPATEQAQMSPAELTKAWRGWGQQMKSAGVSYNLAPVADVVPEGMEQKNAAIGQLKRNLGNDQESVATNASAVVKGLAQAKVGSSLKHYPGLGTATVNTDFGVAKDPTTTLDDAESFLGAMDAGASSVMISSTIYEKIDPDNQAVFSSKVITDGLREKHGWSKVVISDDLGAAAAVKDVPPGERGVRFIEAGGDIVIDADPASLDEMVGGVVDRATSDPDFAGKLDNHVTRVLQLKAELGELACTLEN
ncbi:glycoside hydrolase family 3 N-terminal domain-containing protein [Luteococcus sp. Sow4_B9]|uniref:glycoside hydrolase family 3 N-terminal domain-containing protein n=1 Tax=Luteococcus sp. Sow4_B9 TaxID=3438792 RepID=UPI003F9BB1B9